MPRSNQLLHTYHAICETVDNGKIVRACFATSVNPSTEYGTRVYLLSYIPLAAQTALLTGFLAICPIADSVTISGQASDWASALA